MQKREYGAKKGTLRKMGKIKISKWFERIVEMDERRQNFLKESKFSFSNPKFSVLKLFCYF